MKTKAGQCMEPLTVAYDLLEKVITKPHGATQKKMAVHFNVYSTLVVKQSLMLSANREAYV